MANLSKYHNKSLFIEGNQIPKGIVEISGAKNVATKMMAASLLSDEKVILKNFPTELVDVKYKSNFMEKIGVQLKFDKFTDTLEIKSDDLISDKLDDYFFPFRTTYLLAPGLLKKKGIARIPYPGGCKIGERKYDLHLMIWKKFGCTVKEMPDYIEIEGKLSKGAEIDFPTNTIGGTENALLCASCVDARSILKNVYISPEILDLIKLLQSMGVSIDFKGNSCIQVIGKKKLRSVEHSLIYDRIEAFSWIVYGIISEGDILIKNVPFIDMEIPLIHINNMGIDLLKNSNFIYLNKLYTSTKNLQPFELACGTHPGIISDMQPFFTLLGLKSNGSSRIHDYRYPKRTNYLSELIKFCPNSLKWSDGNIVTKGPAQFKGADAYATDLRGGMSLVLAGLISEQNSQIQNIEMVLRGYNKLEEKLNKLKIKTKIE